MAVAKDTDTYHGSPCKKCGQTLKYSSIPACVNCMRDRSYRKWHKKRYGAGALEKDMEIGENRKKVEDLLFDLEMKKLGRGGR